MTRAPQHVQSATEQETGRRKLRGRVTRVSVRRLKSGEIRHDTLVEFDPGQGPWISERLLGTIGAESADRWRDVLLAGLRERNEIVGGLPAERWHAQTVGAVA